MKKALIGLLAAGTLVGCGGNTYTITGKLDPGITDSVFLMQGNPEKSDHRIGSRRCGRYVQNQRHDRPAGPGHP